MSEQTKESPRGTNSSFWPREKLPELHLICLQARFFGFTRQPEGFIWCVQQGMNWSLAWILLVTPHHTVIGAALKQTVRERRRKKLLWSCDRRWTEVSLWVDVNVLPDLTPAHAASCSMTFDLSPQLWVAAVWYSPTDDVTDEVFLIESHVMSWWHTHTISLKEIQTQCSSVCETTFHHWHSEDLQTHSSVTFHVYNSEPKCVSLTTFGCFITQTETHQTHSILWQSWGLTLGHSQQGTVMTERDHSETQHNTFIFRCDQITHQYHLL